MTFARNRIRMALNTRTPLLETAELATGARPRLPRAREMSIEVALFSDTTLLSTGGIISATIEVKPVTAAGVIDATAPNVMSKTVSSAEFHADLTSAEWTNDSGDQPYHIAFQFSGAETTLTMTGSGAGNNTRTFGWVITAMTSAGRTTLGTGFLICVEEGGSGAGMPTPPSPSYTYTDEQIAAMLRAKVGFGENPAGAAVILVSKDGTQKCILFMGNDGTPHFEKIT